MTSHPRKDNDHSMFMNRTPHFFKVILKEAIQDGKLGIPRSFVRKHGKLLSSPIKLEVPSGAVWQVKLTKCDDTVWLQKGWKEFAEYYSLELGDFVVFRYDGNAHFHVFIFDKSASEIKYPYTSSEDDDTCVKLCDEISTSRKSKEKSHLPCPQPHKKMRTDSPNQPENDLKSRYGTDDPKFRGIKVGNIKKVQNLCHSTVQVDVMKEVEELAARGSVKNEGFWFLRRMTATERDHALQIASAFKSTENPAFIVIVRPSMVHSNYKLYIPSGFAREFLPVRKASLTLCNSAGKTWPVKYYCYAENGKSFAQLNRGGWRVFAEDNNLQVGDICVFELIKHSEIIMKVLIYPVVENANKACRPLSNGSIGGRVKIRNLVSNSEVNCGQSRFPSDSREFKDPKVKEDENNDSCIEILDDFPPNQKTKKKSPFPRSQPSKMMRATPSGSIQATKEIGEITAQRSVQKLTATEKAHAMRIASALRSSENPVFMVVMQPSFVCNSYRMGIPLSFARKFLKMQKGDLTLCDSKGDLTLCDSTGKTWPVAYCCRGGSKHRQQVQLRGGWRAFVKDNNLDVGDICVFELIKHCKILMKVAIYPFVENASKVCNRLAKGRETNGVKIRSLLWDTEPRQSQCPSSSRKFPDPQIEENEDIHSCIEIFDDFQLCEMMKTNPAKKTKVMKQKTSMDFQYLKKELTVLIGKFKYPAKDDSEGESSAWRSHLKPDLIGKMKPLIPTDEERDLIGATSFKSANPSFIVVMKPSYVTGGSLCIPYQFAKKYLKKNGEVILRVSDGRTWVVDYKRKVSISAKAKFCNKSWREFVLDNNLKVGDICVFKLIKENGISLEVVISSAGDIANYSSSKLGCTAIKLD